MLSELEVEMPQRGYSAIATSENGRNIQPWKASDVISLSYKYNELLLFVLKVAFTARYNYKILQEYKQNFVLQNE